MTNFRKYAAEFIGTLVLVVFGCGTACLVGCDASAGSGYILTALAFGLVIVAMAYSIGNVSGCHINPAVSIGMLISGRMKFSEFVGYVVSQCLGATAGAGILKLIFSQPGMTDKTGALGSNGTAGVGGSVWLALLAEVILTFVFVIAVLGVTSREGNSPTAGLVIGLTLTLVHILGIGLTGTSVNPARSIGPALLAGGDALGSLWIFIAAPLAGGALAALVYKALDKKSK